MLTLRPTSEDDFELFNVIDLQRDEYSLFVTDHFDDRLPHMFTFYCGSNPVLLIGIKEMWPMVFDSYTIFSKHWKPIHFRSVLSISKKYLKFIEYDRIQHLVDEERPWTHKMARFLGMECETPNGLKKYVGGETRYMYVLVGE